MKASGGTTSLTREAELALLIAEQEADDVPWVQQRHLSLDKTLSEDGDADSFHAVIGSEDDDLAVLVGANESWVAPVRARQAQRTDVAFWRYLRRQGWSYTKIAQHVGASPATVRERVRKRYGRRERTLRLLAHLPAAKLAYEQGAYLYQIAAELFEECGYASQWSCYQQLRLLFVEQGIPRRPGRWIHGKRSQEASPEVAEAYWKDKNRREWRRKRGHLERCTGTTKRGKACARYALRGQTLCVIHSGRAHAHQIKWTQDTECAAMLRWSEAHGHLPRTHDWKLATDGHPTFKTVYNLFGSWPAAVEAARDLRLAA